MTIDERLQFIAERELAAAVQKHNATSGSLVVMNPYNGEILALASYPTFDPNQPPASQTDIAARANHAVSVPFEPGSCFKIVTLSAALETTRLRPESMINCHNGVLTGLPGHRVIHDTHSLGVVPMADVLAHSSNVGAIEVGRTVGRENLYEYVRRFGIGQKTGVPSARRIEGQAARPPAMGQHVARIGVDGTGSEPHHSATGASRVRHREWRSSREASPGDEDGRSDTACGTTRARPQA